MAKAKKDAKVTIGSVATAAILAGNTNEEVLKEVLRTFPKANTTMSSINWYRNAARKENSRVPTERAVKVSRGITTPRAPKAAKRAPAKAKPASKSRASAAAAVGATGAAARKAKDALGKRNPFARKNK